MTGQPFTVTIYDGTADQSVLREAVTLYSEVYVEPPYLEDEVDFAGFAEDLARRAEQVSFRLVIARLGPDPLGFALGHQLLPSTRWWEGALTPLSAEVTEEYPGRTFAVIELGVCKSHRRHGLGRRLHAHLTVDLTEERQTLLVRPDADPALSAYSKWGYRKVGQVRPFDGAPVYEAMLLEPRRRSG